MQRGLQCTVVHWKIGCDTNSGPLNHASTPSHKKVFEMKLPLEKLVKFGIWRVEPVSSLDFSFTRILLSQSLRNAHKSGTTEILSFLGETPTHVTLEAAEIGCDNCSNSSVHTDFSPLGQVIMVHIWIWYKRKFQFNETDVILSFAEIQTIKSYSHCAIWRVVTLDSLLD